jgi:8-oxo-dGTP pyrophosphatase MutT (NUDIX family)
MPLIMAGAGVIIRNPLGEILLQHRTDSDRWGLPGGAMELAESFEETARREVQEETGLAVGPLELFMLDSGFPTYHIYPNGDPVYLASAYFVTRRFTGAIRPDAQESLDLQWFAPAHLPDLLGVNDRRVIEAYFHAERLQPAGFPVNRAKRREETCCVWRTRRMI